MNLFILAKYFQHNKLLEFLYGLLIFTMTNLTKKYLKFILKVNYINNNINN